MKEMSVFSLLTTGSSNVLLPMDLSSANYNGSEPLRVNSRGSFTYHYAVWPYVCLFTIIVIVWAILYLSTIYARRHLPKSDRYRLSSVCHTQDFATIAAAGERDASVAPPPIDV